MRFGNASRIVVKAVRRQLRNAIEFIPCSVNGIRPRPGGHIHESARCPAELSGKGVSDDAILLHRIQRDRLTYTGRERVNILSAIKQDVSAGRSLSVDG